MLPLFKYVTFVAMPALCSVACGSAPAKDGASPTNAQRETASSTSPQDTPSTASPSDGNGDAPAATEGAPKPTEKKKVANLKITSSDGDTYKLVCRGSSAPGTAIDPTGQNAYLYLYRDADNVGVIVLEEGNMRFVKNGYPGHPDGDPTIDFQDVLDRYREGGGSCKGLH